ncbi:sialate O-acetylesterase [Sphingobacterium bambusae]|uniref:Sialate O-acetylesterase n=1 Tax=Sphingobacterium bambusae TaxID=662858 RepID=A0ABW6BGY9_9SPHI|nr:sialate O-acetylesterase [Sphingobacterium bambusae]WPL49561.1 sialate O-acetylesterase [Sphingobacterium bambusae]
MKRNLVILLLLFSAVAVQAQLRLPHVLSDNMVLQRNATVYIWGWGRAGSTVSLSASWLQDTTRFVVDGSGRWKTAVATSNAGGPYSLDVQADAERITLQNVLLGDVWLCSGQSNMEWSGEQNLKEILDELPKAHDPEIRLLQVSRYGSDYPQDDIPNQWQKLDAQSLKPFSAIGYFIAKELRKELGVPIGIINASWGGTAAEVWTPSYFVDPDPELRAAAEKQTAASFRPHAVGVLWNSMLHPLINYKLSGVFWYQGESNVATWSSYDRLMQRMILSWRLAWNQDYPFYFVQIAPFTYNNKLPLAALLREQQMKTATSLRKTAMVVTTDLVDNVGDIHPIQKRAVAKRLADIALHEHYLKGERDDYKSPMYKGHRVDGKTMVIDFDHVGKSLVVEGKTVKHLFIAGQDKVFHEAVAVVKGNQLLVSSASVATPVAVRFGFGETDMSNLFNSNGLPVAPFRTDDWSF